MTQLGRGLKPMARDFHAFIRSLLLMIALCALATGCAKTTQHDEQLAAKRAIEFAQVTLVNGNSDRGYDLLSAGGKRYISREKFKESVARLHPRGLPTKVTAKEYQPMPGEPAIWIYLVGQNPEEQFQYRFTMEATGNGDYRVLTLDSGVVGRFFAPTSERKSYTQSISTQP
jgi:hypothetical protein